MQILFLQFMHSINSIVECMMLLIMTPKYQTVSLLLFSTNDNILQIIKVKFLGFFGVVNIVKNDTRIENTVTTKF